MIEELKDYLHAVVEATPERLVRNNETVTIYTTECGHMDQIARDDRGRILAHAPWCEVLRLLPVCVSIGAPFEGYVVTMRNDVGRIEIRLTRVVVECCAVQ